MNDAAPAPAPRFSAVIPLYNEVESVAALLRRLVEEFDRLDGDYELVLVDDGSKDGTAEALARLAKDEQRLRPVFLARNYGQSTAMQAGFDAARGKLIVSMDGDLQNDPADIGEMVAQLEQSGADVVSGWRKDRQDPPVRKAFSRAANWLIAKLTGVVLHDVGCSLKVYRREIVERIRVYGELHRFLPALAAEVGAKIVERPVTHHPRRFGASKYNLDRTFRVALDLLLILFLRKYLQRPLHLFGGAGIVCLVPGALGLGYLILLKLLAGADIGGRPLLLLSAFLILTGVTLIGQGLLGEVIARVLHQSGNRPHYHLRPAYQVAALAEDRREPDTLNPLH